MRRKSLGIYFSLLFVEILSLVSFAKQIGAEPPLVVTSVTPKISSLIRLQRETGLVAVEVFVDSSGRVTSTNLLTGPLFARQSVIEAVRQWRFSEIKELGKTRSLILHFSFKAVPSSVPDEMLQPVFKTPYSLELAYKPSPRLYLTPEVYTDRDVSTDDLCKVHGTHLRKDLVQVVYGLLAENRKYDLARTRFFPNEATFVGGGCVVETHILEYEGGYKEVLHPPNYSEVAYCPRCRAARSRWLKAHPLRSSAPARKSTTLR